MIIGLPMHMAMLFGAWVVYFDDDTVEMKQTYMACYTL